MMSHSPSLVALVGLEASLPPRSTHRYPRGSEAAMVRKPSHDAPYAVLSLLLMPRTPSAAWRRSGAPPVPHPAGRVRELYMYQSCYDIDLLKRDKPIYNGFLKRYNQKLDIVRINSKTKIWIIYNYIGASFFKRKNV